MATTVGLLNLVLGSVYVGYGVITLIELKRGWRTLGFSPFGVAWVAMAFTCGPHHLDHGAHVLFEARPGGPFDLVAVLVGLPVGATWLLLRVEALSGGRGDRFISGTPRWLRVNAAAGAGYAVVITGVALLIASGGTGFGPRLTPNVLLVGLYVVIGYDVLRTQLENRPRLGGWSVSGLSLGAVFPTCAFMHGIWLAYALRGRYVADTHGLLIDWISVPAAIYFLQVVRGLRRGGVRDWNESSRDIALEAMT